MNNLDNNVNNLESTIDGKNTKNINIYSQLSPNDIDLYQNNSKDIKSNVKSRKSKLIIIFVIVLILASIIFATFIIKFNNNFSKDNTINNEKIEKKTGTISKILDEDYAYGVLSADEYIMQLAYTVYEPDKIDEKYKSFVLDYNYSDYLFKKFETMIDSLNDNTIMYIFNKYTLGDVIWDVDSNIETQKFGNNSNSYEVMPLTNDNANLKKLSNVKLSNNNNFLIFYTTEGKNAITNTQADTIASFLESMVVSYKDKFGLEFKYETQNGLLEFSSKKNAQKLLKANDIDTKYLETAMPVFIIDTQADKTHNLGYYVPPLKNIAKIYLKITDIYSVLDLQLDNIITTYSFPFFVVSSTLNNFDDTKIILAHELFHHYQKYICGEGTYKDCSSGNFTIETSANLAAAEASGVNKKGSVLSDHVKAYIENVETSLDQIGFDTAGDSGLGYGAFVFAYNYAHIVDNGFNHLFDSSKSLSTLQYLNDHSNGKYKDVLITTAEKNLTLDYANKLLIAENFYPKGHVIITESTTPQSSTINNSSIQYIYIHPKLFSKNISIEFNSSSNDLTLLIFKKENNSYKCLEKYNLNSSYYVNLNKYYDYDEIAIAIINSNVREILTYSYKINKDEEQKLENTGNNVCYDYEIHNGEATIIKKNLSECPETLVIPDEIEGVPVTKIGDEAFLITKIKNVVLGKNIRHVGESAFNQVGLSNITLNDNLLTIGEYAFSNNYIEKIIIPDNVTTIEKYAFSDNPINEITLGSGLEVIEDKVFSGLTSRQEIEPNLEKLVIPDNIKTIKNGAFSSLKIKELALSQNLETIGVGAFNFNEISNLIIPDKVKTIESCAFCQNSLETITIGRSVTTIDYNAFYEDLKSERLKKIINNSGQKFSWNIVIGTLPVASACGTSCRFETGELRHPLDDYVLYIVKDS